MANQLTPEQINTLLDKLGNDSKFYELFKTDSATALKQIGLPESIAACFSKVKRLADQKTILATRSALLSELTGRLEQAVPTLDAS